MQRCFAGLRRNTVSRRLQEGLIESGDQAFCIFVAVAIAVRFAWPDLSLI
jgi:hypothetical protein